MTNQTPWSTSNAIADWFNQLGDAESFFKDNGFSRRKLSPSQIVLYNDDALIVLLPAEKLEVQKKNIALNAQKNLFIGHARLTLEMFVDDQDVENAATTIALNLPIDLEPKDFFNHIKSKIVELENAHKEFVAAYKFIKEQD